MRFCSLASGSAGNSAFIATETTRILVDAGLSVKQLCSRMAEIGERPDQLDAILITHEHTDHISGLARLVKHGISRGRAIPTYLTEITAPRINWEELESPPVKYFRPGASWAIGDIEISSFTVPHDAVDPLAFSFKANGVKVGFATDLGYIPDALRVSFRDCSALLIESNHDIDMLREGPHPLPVKIRVSGRFGHLSNADVADYVAKDLGDTVRHLILGHLSRDNNVPALVVKGAEEALRSRGMNPQLLIAEQDHRTKVIEI